MDGICMGGNGDARLSSPPDSVGAPSLAPAIVWRKVRLLGSSGAKSCEGHVCSLHQAVDGDWSSRGQAQPGDGGCGQGWFFSFYLFFSSFI